MRSRPSAPIVLSGLSLFFMSAVLPTKVGLSEEDPAFHRRVQEQSLECEAKEPYEPPNLCRGSAFRDDAQIEYAIDPESPLAGTIDGDPSTYLTKNCTPDQWLDIRFPGARKWLNFVEIQYTGKDGFEFEIFDFKGRRQKINVISTSQREGPGSSQIETIEFEPVQAKGIRWSWVTPGSVGEEIDIYEISTWFHQIDPDQPVDPDVNDPTNWLLCETAARWIGPRDILPLWNWIRTRPAWCPNMWHRCHLWLPPADWSDDFRRAAAGGCENSHMRCTGMDYHDLSVVACHGRPCRIRFSTGPPLAQRDLVPPWDIWRSWGDRDAEWFCALSCQAYAWPCLWRWGWGFNGLHLQCGFMTNAYFTNGRFLGGFARLMTGGFPWVPPLPVSLSWWLAARIWQPWFVKPVVLANGGLAFFDWLWGYGWVSPDLPPGVIAWAIWDPPFREAESRDREYPPPLTEEQRESIFDIMSGPSSKTIPARSPKGMPVKISEGLLAKDFPDSMTVYHLDPLDVDSSFVLDLALALCMNYGILCTLEIGQDDEGNWWATEDEYALCGYVENGVIQFVNVDEYIAKKDTAPVLPDTLGALLASENLLSNLGLDPTGSYLTGYSYNIQTAYDLELEEIVLDSSFDLAVNVEYYRIVESFTVHGPGAHVGVTWGGDSDLQHFTRGGWQDLVSPTVDPIIDVAQAMDLLTTIGQDATIGGIPPICDTLVIDSLGTQLAYYNTNGEYETDILEPIYKFSCYALSDGDTVACDIFVPALHVPPMGFILEPIDSSYFDEGEMITFEGTAAGGSPPYTYDWYSDEDGYIGSGEVFSTSNLSVVYRDSVQSVILMPHTITLTVTDANNMTSNVSIAVYIVPSFHCGDCNGDSMISAGDVVYLISYLFREGAPPEPTCLGDVNCNGWVDAGDIVYLITYLFRAGPPPCTACCPLVVAPGTSTDQEIKRDSQEIMRAPENPPENPGDFKWIE